MAWNGTQHNPCVPREDNGTPSGSAATLALIGDMKQMDSRWLRGLSFVGYGATLKVGIGVPIPIINEEILKYTAVKDEEIFAPVVDYSQVYPQRESGNLGLCSYADLKSGIINIDGKEVVAAPLSSYAGAREIAETLKEWILKGDFLLTGASAMLPGHDANITLKSRD